MNSPEWMKKAERVARTFQATTAGERGATHFVYVILLHNPSGVGRWGLYVGQTSRDPDLRFEQHKARHKASRAVTRFRCWAAATFCGPSKSDEALGVYPARGGAGRWLLQCGCPAG